MDISGSTSYTPCQFCCFPLRGEEQQAHAKLVCGHEAHTLCLMAMARRRAIGPICCSLCQREIYRAPPVVASLPRVKRLWRDEANPTFREDVAKLAAKQREVTKLWNKYSKQRNAVRRSFKEDIFASRLFIREKQKEAKQKILRSPWRKPLLHCVKEFSELARSISSTYDIFLPVLQVDLEGEEGVPSFPKFPLLQHDTSILDPEWGLIVQI